MSGFFVCQLSGMSFRAQNRRFVHKSTFLKKSMIECSEMSQLGMEISCRF